MKKIAVIGSRNFDNYNLLVDWLNVFIPDAIDTNTEIISGGARGADKLAEKYADVRGIDKDIIIPDWDGLGKKAGFIRNEIIVERADMVIAFWDGVSAGTRHSLTLAKKAKKPTFIVYF